MLIALTLTQIIAQSFVDIITMDQLSQFWLLLLLNIILIGVSPVFYYIGVKLGDVIVSEVKPIIYSSAHYAVRKFCELVLPFVGLLVVSQYFFNSLYSLLIKLVYSDWSVDPIFGLMSYFLSFYIVIFFAFLIGAGIRTVGLLIVDYIFYRSQFGVTSTKLIILVR
jgi:hypothetical protein